jgi:predicted unusual protein kinase regulating ubiquinone biosynthesis (AarF/ABC1/UbiB family)
MAVMREIRETLAHSIDDPLGAFFRGYEVEYHCDRIAALVSSQRGEDPRSIGIALQSISQAEHEAIKQTRLASRAENEIIDIPLLSSHPSTPRRVRANDLLSKQLPHLTDTAPPSAPLSRIDVATLPIDRPAGEHIQAENIFGNTANKIIFRETRELRPHKLFLDKEEFRSWCGTSTAACDDSVPIPVSIEDLLSDLSEERVSDWFREFAEYYDSEDIELPNLVAEFYDELNRLDQSEISLLLENLNPARIVWNTEELNPTVTIDNTREDFCLCLSLIVNQYVKGKMQAGATALQCLDDITTIAEKQTQRFGSSLLFGAPEIPFLAIDIAKNGTEDEHRKLVGLLDQNPALRYALLSIATALKDEDVVSESTRLLKPLLEAYSPFAQTTQETFLALEFRHISMCVEINGLDGEDGIQEPLILRRRPGGEFRILTISRGAEGRPLTLIEIGDTAPRDADYDSIRDHLRQRHTARYHTEGISHIGEEKFEDDVLSVAKQSHKLLQITPSDRETTKLFLRERFAELFSQNRTVTAEASRMINLASANHAREFSLEHRIRVDGHDETTEAWAGSGREAYDETPYTRPESSSFLIFQCRLLFDELYSAELDSMAAGVEKAVALLDAYPVKTLERDQLLCKALEYPSLAYLDDMKAVQLQIVSETDIEVLHLLREGLKNQGLAQTAEVRLYELCKQDMQAFLDHPSIRNLRTKVFEHIPELAHPLVANDEHLLAILSAFTQPSRERDKHLREFIDNANSRSLKEALAGLLADPIVTQISPNIGSESRVSTDSVFSLIQLLSPYDKAQALLYLMGARKFESPISAWLRDRSTETRSVEQLQKKLPLQPAKVPSFVDKDYIGDKAPPIFKLPDSLVRAQKMFGISIETAENLQGGLLNERTITDLLAECLSGDAGILSNKKVAHEFFQLTGRTLVRSMTHLNALPVEERKAIAKFIAFAFENCPPGRLPTLIMRVWEASKRQQDQLPAVVAGILSGLGQGFVKFGQKLATLDIPPEYKRAFRELSSRNHEIDSTLFYHNTEAVFGRPVFDNSRSGRKIAEGSMAAAFIATPLNGDTPRAVKAIHPFIRAQISQDCEYITRLVEYINQHRPFGNLILPGNTAEVIRQQLTRQTDTSLEALNSKQLAANLRAVTPVARFTTPEIDEELCTDGILVASLLPGYELDDPEIDKQGYDSAGIRNEVGLEVLRLLLTGSAYQSDVNLGNFGVLKDPTSGAIVARDGLPTVVWYDPGAVDPISADDQKLLLDIIKSAFKDPSGLPALLSQMVKDVDHKEERMSRIYTSWTTSSVGQREVTPESIKNRIEDFFDAISAAGLEIEERWLIAANTLSMAAPLLKGTPPERFKSLIIDALEQHKMLSFSERILLKARSLF